VVRNPGEESHIVDVRSDIKLTEFFSELMPNQIRPGSSQFASLLL
jgi:hypothetical protein